MEAYRNSTEHLFDHLQELDLRLNVLIEQQRRDPTFVNFNEYRGVFLTEEEIDKILEKEQDGPDHSNRQQNANIDRLKKKIKKLGEKLVRREQMAVARGVPLKLHRIRHVFALTPFETLAILVCLAPEIDLKYERLYAYLHNDVTRKYPSIDLITRLFCESLAERVQARAAFLLDAALFKNRIIAFAESKPDNQPVFPARALKLENVVAHDLLGCDVLDEDVAPFTTLADRNPSLNDLLLPANMKERLIRVFSVQNGEVENGYNPPTRYFFFHGPAGVGKRLTAEAICKQLDRNLLVCDVRQLLMRSRSVADTLAKLCRDARLHNAAVYFDNAEALFTENEKTATVRHELSIALSGFPGFVFLGGEHSGNLEPLPFFNVTFPRPDYALRKQYWKTIAGNGKYKLSEDVDLNDFANKFNFTFSTILRATDEASHRALMRSQTGGGIASTDLNRACHSQSSSQLSNMAKKITPLYTLQDIVLPAKALRLLEEITFHCKYRQKVFEEWKFDCKISLGKGIAVLFIGPPGTGKTMAAEIIAGELGLEMYKIDLSCVVSKYIGETEKNLSRIFAEAEQSNAILFFDEADAIFGKRSQVKDSHDRYANIEINYLLQKMEEHQGVVILASNYHKNIDEAFKRRLRFIISFPFPEEVYRKRIWQHIFHLDTPRTDDIDYGFLAKKFKLAGGSIKNIALHAAFLAASENSSIGMVHLMRATRSELQKMGRLPNKSDFEDYLEPVKENE